MRWVSKSDTLFILFLYYPRYNCLDPSIIVFILFLWAFKARVVQVANLLSVRRTRASWSVTLVLTVQVRVKCGWVSERILILRYERGRTIKPHISWPLHRLELFLTLNIERWWEWSDFRSCWYMRYIGLTLTDRPIEWRWFWDIGSAFQIHTPMRAMGFPRVVARNRCWSRRMGNRLEVGMFAKLYNKEFLVFRIWHWNFNGSDRNRHDEFLDKLEYWPTTEHCLIELVSYHSRQEIVEPCTFNALRMIL